MNTYRIRFGYGSITILRLVMRIVYARQKELMLLFYQKWYIKILGFWVACPDEQKDANCFSSLPKIRIVTAILQKCQSQENAVSLAAIVLF